ncbi:MAG: sulfotransferase family protein [Anaerolineales bacterium]
MPFNFGFNFKAFLTFTSQSLFKSRGTPFRLSLRRIGWLILLYTIFPLLELGIWLGFLWDEIFYRDYRQMKIDAPIFIIGNPRSGTTFLHRLLAKDHQNFTTMKMWEMLFAPSVTARKIVWAGRALDRRLNYPFRKRIRELEEEWEEQNEMHRVALRAPEEDEYLLFHIWSMLKIWTFSAILSEAKPYTYFDQEMPTAEKQQMMSFYTRCLQRHLYAHGPHDKRKRTYLAKNPSFSPMIATLLDYFPNAKFIYLARNPLDVIPSYISLTETEWKILGDPPAPYASRDYILEMAGHWYRYPLAQLEHLPRDQYTIVNLHALIDDVESHVREIYHRLGLEVSPAFAKVLQRETIRARQHESDHTYAMAEMGLTREQIVAHYEDIFERFGFDRRDTTSHVI